MNNSIEEENSKRMQREDKYGEYEEKIKKNARNKEVKKFAKRFNKLLKEKEISNEAFASVTDISTASISNYRSGKTMPNNDILNVIAKELDVSVNHLLGIEECKKYSAQQIHNMLGLSEYAMEHLYSLKHDIEEVKSLDDEEPTSDAFKEQLNVLSLLISDKKNLIYFLNSIKKYIDTREKLLKMQSKEKIEFFEKNSIEDLTQDIIHIRAEIQEYLYMSLDYIVNKYLEEKE